MLAAPTARADGDPASDYLLTRQTFLPFDAKIPKAQVDELNGIVADANKKGFKIRVAIISRRFDLGAVPSLWRKPKTYARFLGQELTFVYKNRLLIVMPNGYGVSRGGKALPEAQRVVDTLPAPGTGGAALHRRRNAGGAAACCRLGRDPGGSVALRKHDRRPARDHGRGARPRAADPRRARREAATRASVVRRKRVRVCADAGAAARRLTSVAEPTKEE